MVLKVNSLIPLSLPLVNVVTTDYSLTKQTTNKDKYLQL